MAQPLDSLPDLQGQGRDVTALVHYRPLTSALLYVAGAILFYGQAVHMLSRDDEVARQPVPAQLLRIIIRSAAILVALAWFAFMTLELAGNITDLVRRDR